MEKVTTEQNTMQKKDARNNETTMFLMFRNKTWYTFNNGTQIVDRIASAKILVRQKYLPSIFSWKIIYFRNNLVHLIKRTYDIPQKIWRPIKISQCVRLLKLLRINCALQSSRCQRKFRNLNNY